MKVVQIMLSPTPAQATLLQRQLDEHRLLYNTCLAKKIKAWTEEEKSVSAYDLIKTEIRPLKDGGAISNYSSLQQTVRRLDKAYSAFFKKNSGFPRFKNKDRFRTIEYTYGDGCKVRGDKIYLQNVGEIDCHSPRFPEKVKALSITKSGRRFYVNLSYEYAGDVGTKRREANVGLDFGLKTFITTSDGEKFQAPKPLKRALKENAKIHRRIHRAKKGTPLREKHKRTLAKVNRNIANRRKDFNHKLSRSLVNRYDTIVVEDINLADLLTAIPNINRAYNDLGFGQLRQFLTYKAENAGKVCIRVNPAYTTQECSSCGRLVEKDLSERIHVCPCGHTEDRDVNAAKNILRRGLASLSAGTGFSFG